MSEILTRFGWENKLKEHIKDCSLMNIWWPNYSTNTNLRLTKKGFELFILIGIKFNSYQCSIPIFAGSIFLGLEKMNCPYYIEQANPKTFYNFYIISNEYGMLLSLLDNDLSAFAKSLS